MEAGDEAINSYIFFLNRFCQTLTEKRDVDGKSHLEEVKYLEGGGGGGGVIPSWKLCAHLGNQIE